MRSMSPGYDDHEEEDNGGRTGTNELVYKNVQTIYLQSSTPQYNWPYKADTTLKTTIKLFASMSYKLQINLILHL